MKEETTQFIWNAQKEERGDTMSSETEILQYLKTMKFKRSLFGVSRSDVLEKIRILNNMYREQQKKISAQTDHSEEYKRKVEVLVKTFVDMQEQADGIIAQAKRQAEEMIETANKEAAAIVDDAKNDLKLSIERQQQESLQLFEQRESMMQELKHLSYTLNQLVQQECSGETGGE